MTPLERPGSFLASVRRKAERMARARSKDMPIWRHLIHVGVLGWVFVLPVLLGAVCSRWLVHVTERKALALLPLLAGVALGGYGVWRQVRPSMSDQNGPGGER